MPRRIAVYAGSFDPITNGHLWVIETAAKLFDDLYVVVANNPAKKYMFPAPHRWALLNRSIKHIQHDNLFTSTVENEFIVKYAKRTYSTRPLPHGPEQRYIVRGIRSVADYEFERQMAEINRKIEPDIETVILMCPPELASVSSSAVKGLIGPPGWEDVVGRYVPESVLDKLKEMQCTDTQG
jgi:pantetheine-phosphate adenylyltransferase